jgi:trans-aconitate methyltransferase
MGTNNEKYNLQPYSENGDSTGYRNLEFYKKNLIPIIDEIISDSDVSVLDLGCGNGRFNELIHNKFDQIMCVDPIDELVDKFNYSNVSYEKKHLHELGDNNYDIIFMLGSMLSIWREYGSNCLNHLNRLSSDGGKVFVIIDNKHHQDFTTHGFFTSITKHKIDDRTDLVVLEK